MRRTALNGQWSLDRSDNGWTNGRAFAAISNDGQVLAWGDATSGGQLPETLSRLLTRQPDRLWIWTVELASSTAAFAARRANGQVLAWGDPSAGGAIPQELQQALSSDVSRLFGLGRSFVALKADGRVIHWGNSGSGISEPSGLDLSQPYRVVTSFDALAILQNGRVVGCWGGVAGAQQWAERSDLRSALASDVLELVCNDAGFAARTSGGQVITWGLPQGIGDASGVSITSRPDIVGLGSDAEGFHGFTARGQIRLWSGQNGQYQAGDRLLDEPTRQGVPISDAVRFFRVPGGGIGWVDDIGVLQLYAFQPSVKEQFIPDVDITINQNPFLGPNGLAVIDQGGDLQTLGYRLDQTNKPDLGSPNPNGPFSPSSQDSSATWQTVRASGGAFAALASNGQIGLWGDAGKGASPVNPQLMQQLLTQSPATSIHSNAGAFVAISGNGTAISWGDGATGGDRNGSPLIIRDVHHLVSPWENVRIDELGPGLFSLIVNGQANPDGQSLPLRVQEGDRLSAVISGDPNGDRSDSLGNVYRWNRNGQAAGDPSQASIDLDALSEGTWSVTPTYLDLPGFSHTLTPLSVQVERIDNGQSVIEIQPYSFSGPADQAFSAGNGKVAELVASLSGDPEGIRSIDAVQWYRDGVAIASTGTRENSLLAATEPGEYSFEATTTDNQGYTTTQRSGLIRIDPAGSVPSQGHLALGGLQTLWRLADEGRSIERFDSTSLRMRQVDMAGAPGYLAISASSDGRAWALANDGVACIYDAASNRFIRLDGSRLDATQPATTLPDLGRGWRQIVAARGSNTAPSLWLLGDIPQSGGSNVAYLPGTPAPGQTLADLRPVVLEGGPALRLLAVGDDQTPWGIDNAGDLWSWDAAGQNFSRLAAGVGSRIRQLQMVDQGQVWALDDQGVLQMWNGKTQAFTPVPLDSPFWTRRSPQLDPGMIPTWESFALSPQGGFVGIPRSGVNLTAGGNGLVSFDTSEIRMLRDPSETISQLQLLSGETLQDNGVRQLGQNLAFNLNNQVNVAYTLNGSSPGQWEGAAVVPKAQSGADLRLEPGPNRDAKGTRLPVLKLRWLSGLGSDGNQAYGSRGYVSPFGGLVFEEAAPLPPAGALQAGLNRPAGMLLGSPYGDSPAASNANNATESSTQNLGYTSRVPIEWNSEIAFVYPNIDGNKIPSFWTGFFTGKDAEKSKGGWKAKRIIRLRLGGYSQPNQPTQIQARADLRYEISRDIAKNLSPGSFTREKPDFDKYKKHLEAGGLDQESIEDLRNRLGRFPVLADKPLLSQYGFYTYIQIDTRWSGGSEPLTEFTNPERFAVAAGTEFRLIVPIKSWARGAVQLSVTLGGTVDYYGLWQQKQTGSAAGASPLASTNDIGNADSFITFIDSRDQSPATSKTPKEDLLALVDPSQIPGMEAISTLEEVTPAVDLITDVIAPIARTVLAVFLPGGDINTAPNPSLTPAEALLLATAESMIPDSLLSATGADLHQETSSSPTPLSEARTPFEATGSFPPVARQGARLRPYVGGLLKFQSSVLDASLHTRVIPYFSFYWDFNNDYQFTFQIEKTIVRLDLEFALLASWTFRERLNIDIPGAKTEPVPLTSSLTSAPAARDDSPRLSIESPLALSRNLNAFLTASDTDITTPIAQLVRADGATIGIITRLLPGNTGLFELCWVRGRKRADGLSIDWDSSSLQRIDGSAGVTSDIQLIELEDGRLAVSASHLDAADPLLLPITQLAPGALFRVDAASSDLGNTTSLSDNTPQLGLPAERVWAQLGSSLASTGSLRSGWNGDSLIAGAAGSNDGAGALYILNGSSLTSLSDLSALESNNRLDQGLVILGSHQSGSLSGLGQRVVDGGDTNRDGFSEILASAPNDQDGAGLVYMLYGGRALELLPTLKSGSIDLDTLDTLQSNPSTQNQFLQRFSGVSGDSGYGSILSGGQDLNGDGLTDPLIGYAADSDRSGSLELWSSRADLRQQDFLGLSPLGQQSIPRFDRSVWVSARSTEADQSDFHLYAASSVGDLNADGYSEIALSSDSRAALVFGDRLMPVYWEASSVLGSLAAGEDPGAAAPSSRTWTASWTDAIGRRLVLSFCGRDADGDGRLSTATPSEIDWLALRVDSPDGEPLVALSDSIAGRWLGALTISDAALNFDLSRQSFTAPVRLEADDETTSFRWSSDDAGVSLEQGARALRARLINSAAPGVLNAAGIGDFNGDGLIDLALSQAGYRIPNSDGTGLVDQPGQSAVLFGDRQLADSEVPLPLEQISNGGSGLRLNSGGELSAIGDWNRDGKADLLIRDAAASGSGGTEQAGRQVLLLGREAGGSGSLTLEQELQAGRAQVLQGSAANSRSGTDAAAGDFTGDGGRSLFLGAPNTISESDLRQAAAGVRVFTASQNLDGSWRTPQQIPLPQAAGLQQLSSFTAVGERILATWVRTTGDGEGGLQDELWAAFQSGDGQWQPAALLQTNRRRDATEITIGEVNGLALGDAQGSASGGVLLAWTCLDPVSGRSFLFQSTYLPATGWTQARQQDLQALLRANQDAISGSQLKLQLNPGAPEQRSQVWAEAGISSEGEASAWINLRRSGNLSQPLSLNYSTRDQSASAGSQYVDTRGTVQFAAGEASLSVAIPLLDNSALESRNTSFAVDFSLPDDQLASARPQLLLGDTPVARPGDLPILSVSAGVQDNDAIRMRAIDAGISLLGPLTGSTGEAAAASSDASLKSRIALVSDPGAQDGLGQVYALFVAANTSSPANPGMDWKELNAIDTLDQPSTSEGQNKRQLNVLIRPEDALAALDPRAGFGSAMVTLTLAGQDYFAISAPGNPLDGTKTGRVYIVSALTIQSWADSSPTPVQPLILNERNSLIIEQTAGGLFGSALAAADLNSDQRKELIVGAPGSSSVFIFDGTALNRVGRTSVSSLNPKVIDDPSGTSDGGGSGFGTAITALDLDGDGFIDLAIGAPRAQPVRASSVFDSEGPIVASAGTVSIVRGTGTLEAFQGGVAGLVRGDKALALRGQALVNERGDENDPARPASEGLPPPGSFGFGEELGSALAAVDLNGDTIADLAIGGPQYTPDGTLRTGRVITWFGHSAIPWGRTVDLGSVSPQAGVTFVGQQGGGRVGASLAAAGDLQSDDNQDLAIGAPMEDADAGRVYVAFGSRNRYGLEALKTTGNRFDLDATSPDSPFQTFEAPDDYRLGQSVVGLGDVNNDSRTGIGGDDLFLGSPAAIAPREVTNDRGDLQLTPAGQTHLAWGRPWLGPNQSLDVPFTQGVGYLLPFGGVPLALGDLNGDGYGDYGLLGSSGDQGGATAPEDATRLRIRFGAAMEYEQKQLLLSQFDLKPAGTPLASDQTPLVVVGDFDGDAFGDVIAYTQTGLKLLSGAPNLSLQGDAQTRWNNTGTPLNISGSNDTVSQLASGDYDGDGYDDLVVVNQNPTLATANPTLSLFWGSAQGLQFGGQRQLPSGQPGRANPAIDGLIALDSNGDGSDELALYGNDLGAWWQFTSQRGWGLQLLRLDRKAADPFGKAVQSLVVETGANGVPTTLSRGDLNGDGLADLLIDHGGNNIDLLSGNRQAFLNPSGLTFTRQQGAPANIQRTQLARFIGDVNADGRDDLLFSPTSPSPTNSDGSPLKHGPYSFLYLGSERENSSLSIPRFWDAKEDNEQSPPTRIKPWSQYGHVIESLPGESSPYRTGSIGDVNGDGFDEVLFSSNQLFVNGKPEQRPHAIAIYGSSRLSTEALQTTTSNDGTIAEDSLHQLGSAGKQELHLRGKAGSDLLQVHADPYGATLSIPSSGENAGRLTVSASNGSTLWTQPRNPYELVLRDGKLQIISAGNTLVHQWGGGDTGNIDRLYLDPKTGWLYGMDALQAYLNGYDDVFTTPDWSSRRTIDRRSGFSINTGFYSSRYDGFTKRWKSLPADTPHGQLIFFPESGRLVLANRGAPDLTDNRNVNTDQNILFEGVGSLKGKERYSQVMYAGESLLSEAGAQKLSSTKGPTSIPMLSLNDLEASRHTLTTFLTDDGGPNRNSFGLLRNDNRRSGSGGLFTKDLQRVLGNGYSSLQDGWAWVASADENGDPLTFQDYTGPLVVTMDGNGRLTINAQNKDSGQIKPGSELAVLHAGNPDPFLPPIGSEPVLLRPGFSTDQITQSPTGSRSTNNNFLTVLKGGLDDDRLGVDALERIGAIDGGPGVDTLFFSSQRSDGTGSAINLVGLGSRIRDIEAIEIPINNSLNLDEAPLLNTPLHRLKISSRGAATVNFQVRQEYAYIGDQIDAGLAYSVYAKPASNLQLWIQQGRVNLNQILNATGSSASLAGNITAEQAVLTAADPIDADQLAMDPAYAYRWYRDGLLIAEGADASYGEASGQWLQPGIYHRETDYTDRSGLRQTVSSAPLQVSAAQAIAGGTLQVLRTELDADQRQRLDNRQPGLKPEAELVQLLLRPGASGSASSVQRIGIRSSNADGSGLIALLNPGQAWPESVSGAGAYDFNGDGSLDTLTWEPTGVTSGSDSLQATLLRGSRAMLAVQPDGNLSFVVQEPSESVRSVDAGALQSLRVSVLASPSQVSAVLAIALAEGESIADLSNAQRRQRAISLLSHQDDDPARLASGADRTHQLWLRADQQLVLLELPGKTLSDWDGSLVSEPLKPAQPLPQSGIADARLQLGSDSGLRIELEALSTPQDLNSYLARSQTQAPLLDFRGLDGLSLQANLEVAREAEYTTTMGFYAVDGLDGSIRDPLSGMLVTPGDPNYGALAAANRIQALDGLASDNRSSTSRSLALTESRLLAPYAVVADPQLGSQTYYAFAAANPDGISHFRSFGSNVIGLEDLAGGGDLDYDDHLMHLKLSDVTT